MADDLKSSHQSKGKPPVEKVHFQLTLFQIDENFPLESEFLRVFANDSDVGLNGLVTYELLNHKNKFRLDNFSGSLTTVARLNFNEASEYDLSIVAVDRGRPSLR